MTVDVDMGQTIGRIDPKLHGQFIEFLGECIDQGLWVGEDSPIPNVDGVRADVLDALRKLQPPLLRWPGGCYSDIYHWRDGIGSKSKRKTTYNENFGTYGPDDHGFGTDEFLKLCETIGAEPWINVNMLTGSPEEMRDWMEYCNRDEGTDLARERARNGHQAPYGVKYWGLGNEVWCGGGHMTPEGYVDRYRSFASAMPSFCHSVAEKSQMYAIASGPDLNKPMESVAWTQGVMRELDRFRQPPISGYDAHFYNWNIDHESDSSDSFNESDWNRVVKGCLQLEDLLVSQRAMLDQGLALVPHPEVSSDERLQHIDLVVGEWGNWHRDANTARPALRQQVTMRDAVTTALTLDLLQRHCDFISMACNAQTINVLNSLILTDGPNMVLTPNYHVFMMFKGHRGAKAINLPRKDNESGVYVFASYQGHELMVDLVNPHMNDTAKVKLRFNHKVTPLYADELYAENPTDCNTPERPDLVSPKRVELSESAADHSEYVLHPGSVNTLHFNIKK